MRKRSELFLEESVLDDMASSLDCVEMSLTKGAFSLVMIVGVCLVLAVFGRVFFLGVNAGAFYKSRAAGNMSNITVTPAERGIFFDRNGKQLVKNIPTFRVVLNLSDFLKKSKGTQEQELGELARIADINGDDIGTLLSEVDLERQSTIVLARELTIGQVAAIKNLNYDDINIENDFSRQYEEPGVFSHVTGYVGLVSDKNMKNDPDLLLNDLIGKSGLELQYDKELRGKNGEIIEYRNAKGESLDQKAVIAPSRGNNAYLTIDGDLQQMFQKRFQEQLRSLGRTAGAGIVMDPKTGEILSMISLPSFDNNNITTNDLTNPSRPLFNRVISGVYSPASTIKPLDSIASLVEHTIEPTKRVFSKGYIEIPNPYHPEQPSRFADWKAHGWVDMYSAIARSSDVYFYAVGGGFGDVEGLGIDRLHTYWDLFGLDQKTNIDIPGEKVGFLPSPDEKETRTKTPWRIGDTYNVSIGQGDLMTTPIELTNYIAGIANRGTMFEPFLLKKMVNEKGDVVAERKPTVLRDLTRFASAMGEVEKGMIQTTQKEYGTAYMLHDLPFVVAGKTGSAQVSLNSKTNAFFVGYGPVRNASRSDAGGPVGSDRPIVVLVLIEDSLEGGHNAVPVAYDVFKWYYTNRILKS